MAYGDFKDLARRTASDKVYYVIKHLILLKIQNMIDIKEVLLLWFKFFYKKSASLAYKSGMGTGFKSAIKKNEQLAEELRKPVIRKFEKRKIHSSFRDNICGADVVDIQLIIKFNKRNRILLCVVDIFSKYAWFVPLKDKKDITITNTFQKLLDKSGRKPYKIWLDKSSGFYNRSMKSCLQNNNIQHIMKENLLLL